MKAKISNDLTKILSEELNPLNILNNFRIEIGVWDTNFDRKDLDKKQVGVSNAQLMYIHEFGSKARNIPKRPILEKTIEWGYKRLDEYYFNRLVEGIINEGWTEYEITNCLKQLAAEMEAYCKEKTQKNEFDLTPLKPSTIKGRIKHSDVPLYDTGQLVKSIRCQVVKI